MNRGPASLFLNRELAGKPVFKTALDVDEVSEARNLQQCYSLGTPLATLTADEERLIKIDMTFDVINERKDWDADRVHNRDIDSGRGMAVCKFGRRPHVNVDRWCR